MGEHVTRHPRSTAMRGPYFEGWYFKLQTGQGEALALIPAFHIDRSGRRSASLQVIVRDQSWWLDYPGDALQVQKEPLRIRLGASSFAEKGVEVSVERAGLSLNGTVRFGPLRRLSSDIMGPFRFLPHMECTHGVISMAHTLEGALVCNGRTLDFSGGVGYVETDRGRSFPSRYLWSQCVWPESNPSSIMLAAGSIPLPVGSFRGCICAVVHGGREYRLATYRGARIRRWTGEGVTICQGSWRLDARLETGKGQALRAPVEGTMGRIVHESLSGAVHYRFTIGGRPVLDRTGRCASFESSGK